jgi:hypothetical protein
MSLYWAQNKNRVNQKLGSQLAKIITQWHIIIAELNAGWIQIAIFSVGSNIFSEVYSSNCSFLRENHPGIDSILLAFTQHKLLVLIGWLAGAG